MIKSWSYDVFLDKFSKGAANYIKREADSEIDDGIASALEVFSENLKNGNIYLSLDATDYDRIIIWLEYSPSLLVNKTLSLDDTEQMIFDMLINFSEKRLASYLGAKFMIDVIKAGVTGSSSRDMFIEIEGSGKQLSEDSPIIQRVYAKSEVNMNELEKARLAARKSMNKPTDESLSRQMKAKSYVGKADRVWTSPSPIKAIGTSSQEDIVKSVLSMTKPLIDLSAKAMQARAAIDDSTFDSPVRSSSEDDPRLEALRLVTEMSDSIKTVMDIHDELKSVMRQINQDDMAAKQDYADEFMESSGKASTWRQPDGRRSALPQKRKFYGKRY